MVVTCNFSTMGRTSLIRQTGTGSLFISNATDDEDIVINTDDGSGGQTNYFRADGSTGELSSITMVLRNLPPNLTVLM